MGSLRRSAPVFVSITYCPHSYIPAMIRSIVSRIPASWRKQASGVETCRSSPICRKLGRGVFGFHMRNNPRSGRLSLGRDTTACKFSRSANPMSAKSRTFLAVAAGQSPGERRVTDLPDSLSEDIQNFSAVICEANRVMGQRVAGRSFNLLSGIWPVSYTGLYRR